MQAQLACRRLQVCNAGLDVGRGRVRENAEHRSIGYHLAEQLQSFRLQIGRQNGSPGEVRTRPVEAGDKTQRYRVSADLKDDRYGSGRCLRRQRCGGADGYDYRYAATNEIGCKCGQPI